MPNRLLLGFALVGTLAALAFPFAPVRQPEVRYDWSASDSAAAIPLLPYQPIELRMTTHRACGGRPRGRTRVVLSTAPLRPDPAADPLYGLRLTATLDQLRLVSAGVELGSAALPAGDCTVGAGLRPASAPSCWSTTPRCSAGTATCARTWSARSASCPGPGLTLTADTRFQTDDLPGQGGAGRGCAWPRCSPCWCCSAGRTGRAGRAGAAAAAGLVAARARWTPRWAVLLGGWWLVGAVTVDDGYIAGIVRSRDANGFVGNVYRWLNAPEAPFSWIYELYDRWAGCPTSTRLAAAALDAARVAVLGAAEPAAAAPAGPVRPPAGRRWLAALAFGTWWIPFNLGLRPEPWVAVGGLAVFLCRGAGAGHPAGPAAGRRAAAGRGQHRGDPGRGDGVRAAGRGRAAAGPAAAGPPRPAPAGRCSRCWSPRRRPAVLLMVSDQSAAAVVEATRVRQLIGGGGPWYAEYERYAALLEPDSFQGAIGRRAAVLITLLAAVATLSALRARPAGAGLADRTGPPAGDRVPASAWPR